MSREQISGLEEQFTTPLAQVNRNVRDAVGPQGRLAVALPDRDFTSGGIRTMWVQVKVLFEV